MKALIRILAPLTLALAAIASAQSMSDSAMMNNLPVLVGAMAQQMGTAVAKGSFYTLEAPTKGTVTIYKHADGTQVLVLNNFKTEVGPDLQLWLSAATPKKGDGANLQKTKYVAVGLFKKAFDGNFEVKLPKGLDLSHYKSVLLWCEQVKTPFGAALLK
ncbi:MAG: DM13 domain-containing protein [Thermaceae bacterium]|nr:DM13 domain-containing protein [Thermaceae bacterium]